MNRSDKYSMFECMHDLFNKRISVKIFLRLISPPCAHYWPLFLFIKTYKGSLYLLVTLEKSLDIFFTLFFLLESSKLCPVCKPPFCLPWPHPLYVKARVFQINYSWTKSIRREILKCYGCHGYTINANCLILPQVHLP